MTEYRQVSKRWMSLISFGVCLMLGLSIWLVVNQIMVEQRNFQVDETSIRERAELRRRVDRLESEVAADRQAYGNRGIIQKALLDSAISEKSLTAEQKDLLRQIAGGANYPSDK